MADKFRQMQILNRLCAVFKQRNVTFKSVCTERMKNFYNSQQSYAVKHWRRRWMFTLSCVLGIPTVVYARNNFLNRKYSQLSLHPAVLASEHKYNRQNFNPVADLVERTAGAVVHIESVTSHGRFFRPFGYAFCE